MGPEVSLVYKYMNNIDRFTEEPNVISGADYLSDSENTKPFPPLKTFPSKILWFVKPRGTTQHLGNGNRLQILLLDVLGRRYLRQRQVAPIPGMVPEREAAVDLDQRMPVRKGEVSRQPDQIRRVLPEMRPDLDHLGPQDPQHHERQKNGLTVSLVVEAGAGQRPYEEGIPDDGEVDQARDVDCVDAPGEVDPGVQVAETREVAAPGRPSLSEDLSVKLARVAEGRGDFTLGGVLDANLPAVAQDPSGDVVVIVWVERSEKTEEESLILETSAECFVLEDLCSNSRGSA